MKFINNRDISDDNGGKYSADASLGSFQLPGGPHHSQHHNHHNTNLFDSLFDEIEPSLFGAGSQVSSSLDTSKLVQGSFEEEINSIHFNPHIHHPHHGGFNLNSGFNIKNDSGGGSGGGHEVLSVTKSIIISALSPSLNQNNYNTHNYIVSNLTTRAIKTLVGGQSNFNVRILINMNFILCFKFGI
jgi:hypothetical protein